MRLLTDWVTREKCGDCGYLSGREKVHVTSMDGTMLEDEETHAGWEERNEALGFGLNLGCGIL